MPEKRAPKNGPSPELRKKLEDLEDKVEKPSQITRIKRLQDLQEKLEGAHKIERLKNIEKKVILAQVVGILIFFPIIMYVNGISLEPFYLPLYHSSLMVLIWTLILSLQAFMFKIIEIKRHESYSAKYIIARRSIRRAIPVVVIALIILTSLYTPYVVEEINSRSSVDQRIELNRNGYNQVELTNKGRLDFRVLKNLTVNPHHSSVRVRIYDKQTKNDIINERINKTTTFQKFNTNEFSELVLRVNSSHVSQVSYNTHVKLNPTKRTAFTLLSFFYIAIFSEWAALLYPIKKRYSGVGIYH